MRPSVPDPKPDRRIVDGRAGVDKVRSEGRCRSCGRHGLCTRHHLVPKSLGGDDVDENIVPVCGDGTTLCHGALTDHRPGWREVARWLRRNLRPEEVDYILQVKSLGWLDRYYPQ